MHVSVHLHISHILIADQNFGTNRIRPLFPKSVRTRFVQKTVDRIYDIYVCVCVRARVHHCKHYYIYFVISKCAYIK